jgi:dienelactone hydrolase
MLVDRSRRDPFDPRHRPRRLMIQLWYPAERGGARAAYLPARVGRLLARDYRLPAATFTRITTNAFQGGEPLQRGDRYPVIVFSPGYRVPRNLYSTLFEDLASRGFVVVAFDHTYESEAVQFPDGRLVRRTLPENPIDPKHPTPYRLILKMIDTRISDMRFVLRTLPRINRAVGRTMDTRRVGVFGHSLGGLTAAANAGTDATVRAGADLDGSIYGPGARKVTSRPFMIMTHHGEATMATYWSRLHRPRLFVRINGTRHLNFSDWNVLSRWLRTTSRRIPSLGPIAPARALAIVRAYLFAFFDRYVADAQAPLLDQPSPWPEVTLRR